MRRDSVSDRTIGRKERVCGQIGVSRMPGMDGWTNAPPAESEYAVDPIYICYNQHVRVHVPSKM